MIITPPRIVGVASVARLFGIAPSSLRRRMRLGAAEMMPGYLGKISGRHAWNSTVLIATVFGGDTVIEEVVSAMVARPVDPLDRVLCSATACDEVAQMIGLCPVHLHRLLGAFRRAPRSSLVLVQLVAMCRWVVERHAHLVLPDDFDPWSSVCMTPGCGATTNVAGFHGPLCRSCSARFWRNAPRVRPAYWKQPA